MESVRAVVVSLTLLAGLSAQAHGGHGGDVPTDHAPREPPQSRPQQERTDRSSSVGRSGGGERPTGGPVGQGGRRLTAPHGGKLIATTAGWAEVVVDDGGAVSVWFLDREGAILAPPSAGFATVVGDRPQALGLQARGDKLVGQLSSKKQPAVLIVQADVAGRSTTVRMATAQR